MKQHLGATPKFSESKIYSDIVKISIYTALSCIGTMIFIIFLLLPRGLDFSDTGFFYNSIFNREQIDMQTTQFAVVWSIFSFTDSILLHRIIVLIFMWGSAHAFLQSAFEFYTDAGEVDNRYYVRHLLLSALIVIPFYGRWLPDPSYNSLGLTLLLIIFALTFRISGRLARSARDCRTELIMAGFVVLPLFLTRPLAPIPVAAFVIPFLMITARPRTVEIGRAMGWFLAGVAGYFLFQIALIEPPSETLDRISGGLERRELLARGDVIMRGFARLEDGLVQRLSKDWATLIPLTLLAGLIFARDILPGLVTRNAGWLGAGLVIAVLATLAFRGVNLVAIYGQPWVEPFDFVPIGFGLHAVTILALIILPVVAAVRRSPPILWARGFAVGAAAVVLSLAAILGAAVGWLPKFQIYSGVIIASFAMIILSSRQRLWTLSSVTMLSLAVALAFLSLKSLYQFPYRLPAPLSAQTEIAPNPRGLDLMRVDPVTQGLLADIIVARQRLVDVAASPALIDLSGRLPLIAFLLEADTPRSPWIPSNYPGSQDLFDFTYTSLSDETLRGAWILESPDWARSLDPGVLAERGLEFPSDYELVVESWSEYLNSPIRIWAPQATLHPEVLSE